MYIHGHFSSSIDLCPLTESHSNPPTLSPAGHHHHHHHHHHPYSRPPGCCSERRCKDRPLVVVVADGAGVVPTRLPHLNRTLVESVTGRSERRCRGVMKRHLSGLPARRMRAQSFSSHPLEGGSCTAACAETKAQRPGRRSHTNEAASLRRPTPPLAEKPTRSLVLPACDMLPASC